MGQGRDQAKEFLKANPKYKEDLRTKLFAANGIGQLLMTQPSSKELEDSKAEAPVTAAPATEEKKKKKH
jgi:hypothetical protein